MEDAIHDLLGGYEKGTLSRRELVGALTVLAATTQIASAAGFESNSLSHVSIIASNLDRSVEFYRRVFALSVASEDKVQHIVRLKIGSSHLSIHHHDRPPGIDFFGIGLDHFDKARVIADLKARGATLVERGDGGVYVVDPDGLNIKLSKNS